MHKIAVSSKRLRVAQTRTGRPPVTMSTLLRKEKEGTLYKSAVHAAFADELAKHAGDAAAKALGHLGGGLAGDKLLTHKYEKRKEAAAATDAPAPDDPKRDVVRDIVRKYPALARRSEVAAKTAGVLGNLRGALRSPNVREHMTELGGLGVLAVPGLDTLQAHARARIAKDRAPGGVEKRRLLGEGAHAALDVGGLGILMGPELKHLVHK